MCGREAGLFDDPFGGGIGRVAAAQGLKPAPGAGRREVAHDVRSDARAAEGLDYMDADIGEFRAVRRKDAQLSDAEEAAFVAGREETVPRDESLVIAVEGRLAALPDIPDVFGSGEAETRRAEPVRGRPILQGLPEQVAIDAHALLPVEAQGQEGRILGGYDGFLHDAAIEHAAEQRIRLDAAFRGNVDLDEAAFAGEREVADDLAVGDELQEIGVGDDDVLLKAVYRLLQAFGIGFARRARLSFRFDLAKFQFHRPPFGLEAMLARSRAAVNGQDH